MYSSHKVMLIEDKIEGVTNWNFYNFTMFGYTCCNSFKDNDTGDDGFSNGYADLKSRGYMKESMSL